MAEDSRSDLDSVFGSEGSTSNADYDDKRSQTKRNKKLAKKESSSLKGSSRKASTKKKYQLSGTKSETATLRPVTASASVMYGLPEVQDYVPRPVTSAADGTSSSLKRRSKSLRCVKESGWESKYSDDYEVEDEEFGHHNRHVSFAYLDPDMEARHSSQSSPSVRSKSSTMILKQLQESLDEMIEEEDEMFKNKYSDWISELFHNELKALRKRLRTQFQSELEELVASHEEDLTVLEEKYHEKLMEFEQSSESFRDWLNALEEENRHLQTAKDWETGALRVDVENVQRNLEIQLEKQRSQMQAEHNREMERLIREHEKQLAHATGQSAVCGQLNALRRTVSNLKNQNAELQKKISLGVRDTETNEAIEELRARLNQAELDKSAMSELHEQQMTELKDSADKNITKLQALLSSSQQHIEALKKAYDEEVSSLRNSLSLQELHFNQTLSTLQSKYDSKIESLTAMIDRLQNNCPT